MQPRVKGALWSNDAAAVKPAAGAAAAGGQPGAASSKRKRQQDAVEDADDEDDGDEEDDALYQELPSKAATGAADGEEPQLSVTSHYCGSVTLWRQLLCDSMLHRVALFAHCGCQLFDYDIRTEADMGSYVM